jgi:hypothetical protein
MSKVGSGLPRHGLGSVHSRARLFGFSFPAVFIMLSVLAYNLGNLWRLALPK